MNCEETVDADVAEGSGRKAASPQNVLVRKGIFVQRRLEQKHSNLSFLKVHIFKNRR